MPADRRSAYLRTATTAGMSNRRAASCGSQAAGRSACAADQNRSPIQNDSKSIDRFFVIPARVGIFPAKLPRSVLDPRPLILISVIPAKAGTQDFSRLLLGPRFSRGRRIWLSAGFADKPPPRGVMVNGGRVVIDTLARYLRSLSCGLQTGEVGNGSRMTRREFATAASAANLALGFTAALAFIMRNDLRALDPMWTTMSHATASGLLDVPHEQRRSDDDALEVFPVGSHRRSPASVRVWHLQRSRSGSSSQRRPIFPRW
jgi:hypothetical protein